MDNEQALEEVVEELKKFQIQFRQQRFSYNELKKEIGLYINHVVTTDFSLLISILYRLDISEKKLKELLNRPNKALAGDIIAELIIERQLQKIASRKAFRANPPDICDDEKW